MVLTLTPAGSIRKLLSVCLPTTLGARDFSCAVSSFGQAFISDPREKPLDRTRYFFDGAEPIADTVKSV